MIAPKPDLQTFAGRCTAAAMDYFGGSLPRNWQTRIAAELGARIGKPIKPQTVQFMVTKARSSLMTSDFAAITGVRTEWLSRGTGPRARESNQQHLAESKPQYNPKTYLTDPSVPPARVDPAAYVDDTLNVADDLGLFHLFQAIKRARARGELSSRMVQAMRLMVEPGDHGHEPPPGAPASKMERHARRPDIPPSKLKN